MHKRLWRSYTQGEICSCNFFFIYCLSYDQFLTVFICLLPISVGMLEPFECKFIIDIIERSIRDVLLVVPNDLRPTSADGRMVELKPYEPYVSQGEQAGGDESMGIDVEYVNALNFLREVFE